MPLSCIRVSLNACLLTVLFFLLPSRWPQLAQAHKVPVYGAIPALPMFILFEKGKEVGRIPHMYEGAHWSVGVIVV